MGGIRCKDILDVVASVYNVRICETPIGEKPKNPVLLIIWGAVPLRVRICAQRKSMPNGFGKRFPFSTAIMRKRKKFSKKR